MIEIELEEFLEEVKFEMTEYEELTKELIIDWENKARKYLSEQKDQKHIKKVGDDIILKLKNEEAAFMTAEKYHRAYNNGKTDEYWKHLRFFS